MSTTGPIAGRASPGRRRSAEHVLRGVALVAFAVALALPSLAMYRASRTPSDVAKQVTLPPARPPAAAVRTLAALRYQSSIPVLTFHNIESTGSDYAVTPQEFSLQMATLHAAGFRTVSAHQFVAALAGRPVRLPAKPILITFDDGAKSVWVYADKVLERYGFRAVMFTITGRVGKHQPYYLDWHEIERMAKTGRWDFESHTRYGHRRIIRDAQGDVAAFLTNKLWIPRLHRVETREGWRQRVELDLDSSIRDLQAHHLGTPEMFAFPFSAYSVPTNDAAIPGILSRLVHRRFPAVMDNVDRPMFVQAGTGDRYLPRIEIFMGTTPQTLAAKIAQAAVRTNDASPPLPLGRESVYSLVNAGTIEAANLLLRDTWPIPRSAPAHLAMPLTWREDPYRDPYWRFLFYSLRPTSNLLWAYERTHREAYRTKLLQILRSYTRMDSARPPGERRAFTLDNRHAAGFREMVLVNTYVKLQRSSALPPSLAAPLLRSIDKLGRFLADPRNFEGEHNHGFTEAAALLLAATNFPSLPRASGWRRLALDRLRYMLAHTVGPDGVEIENSPFYHFYALTFVSQIAQWAKANRVALPAEFTARAHAMVRFATQITLPNGQIPLLGASVSLVVRRLDSQIYDPIGRENPGFAWVRSGGLLGRPPTERNVLFPSAGISVMHSGFGPAAALPRQTEMTFDVGPYRTAHSDLDALSLTYFSAGRSLLPDSGLYTYAHGPWRDYFHGTRAHNTVVVDGEDQQRGDAHAGLTATGPGWAYQSGSSELYAGVVHRRSVVLLRRDVALVVDSLRSARVHRYTQTWHLFPDARLERQGIDVAARDDAGVPALTLRQAPIAGAALAEVSGATRPIQGWYSELYGRKVRNEALEYSVRGRTARFATLIASGRYASSASSVASSVHGDTVHVTATVGAQRFSVTIVHQAEPGERVAVSLG